MTFKTKPHHCETCGETEPAAFQKGKKSMCKKCKSAYNAKWRVENADQLKAYKAKLYAENADRERKRQARYRAENPDRAKAATAKWKAENPEKLNAYASKRRATELQATPGWEFSNTKIGIAKYAEAHKLKKDSGIEYNVDHTVPLAGVLVCGLHTDANLQVIPATENNQKHNKFDVAEYNDLPEILPEEQEWFDFFLQEKKHYDKLLAELK